MSELDKPMQAMFEKQAWRTGYLQCMNDLATGRISTDPNTRALAITLPISYLRRLFDAYFPGHAAACDRLRREVTDGNLKGEVTAGRFTFSVPEPIPQPEDEGEIGERLNEEANGYD